MAGRDSWLAKRDSRFSNIKIPALKLEAYANYAQAIIVIRVRVTPGRTVFSKRGLPGRKSGILGKFLDNMAQFLLWKIISDLHKSQQYKILKRTGFQICKN